jgi:hypothetical protein
MHPRSLRTDRLLLLPAIRRLHSHQNSAPHLQAAPRRDEQNAHRRVSQLLDRQHLQIELCNQSFGGSDHIAEEHLRHVHHIAYQSKHLCESLTLPFIFHDSWSLGVELTDGRHPEGHMLSLENLLGYSQFAQLEKLSKLPAVLEAEYCARNKRKRPIDPSTGQGFGFDELAVFFEALDAVYDSFDNLPRYCTMSML